MISNDVIHQLRGSRFPTAQAVANNLSQFNSLLAVDADMAAVRSRKALDLIMRNVARLNAFEPMSKTLESLLVELQKAHAVPALLIGHCRVVKDLGNLAAHGDEDPQQMSDLCGLSSTEVEMCETAITAISHWYLTAILPRVADEFPYRVLSGQAVTPQILEGIKAIDEQVYAAQFLNPSIHDRWCARNPDIYTVAVDRSTGRVCGYINAMPVDEKSFRALGEGKINDWELPPENIRRYDLPDFYKMWFCSIAIEPSYQCTFTYKLLVDAFIDKLMELAQHDQFITEIMGDAVTPAGKQIAEYAGMQRVSESPHSSTIYKVTLLPPSLRVTTAKGKRLLTYYKNKYEDFRELLS